jgi:anti-sigma factor RsiW
VAGVNPRDDRISVLLSCYLDGELTPSELDAVVHALETDLDVIAEFRRLQALRRAVRTLPILSVPPSLLPGAHQGDALSAYLDGELSTAEMSGLVDHLRVCDDCRLELADLDRSRTAVRSLPGLEPPSFLEVEKVSRRRRPIWPVAVAGTAAAAALVVAVGAARSAPQATPIDLADLQSRHAAVASVSSGPSAVEVSSP